VALTHFELFYKAIDLRPKQPDSPLHQAIDQTDHIGLAYHQNVFAFGFSALEFLSPQRIRYGFMLEGYDTDWNIVSANRRYANYTNIDPGEYTFSIKATNKDGIWSNQKTSIKITIASPWWLSTAAVVSYLLAVITVIYLFIAFRTRLLTNRANKLELSVQQRTEEVAAQKQKVEQLLAQKHDEFATVSHEFRTPLTLILGPLSQLLASSKSQRDIERLNIVQRNGYRLLRMVDQLLNLETVKVTLVNQKATQDTGKIIRLLSAAFIDLAKQKDIVLNFEHIIDIQFKLVPDALEKIVLNLLSNALKYTKPNGTVTILTQRTRANELNIKVVDNGIGIPPEQIQNVFERYQRVLDENSEQVTGAGIGLALVKSLVEVHQGRVELSSTLGKGTTIDVFLPITAETDLPPKETNGNKEVVAMELMSIAGQLSPSSSKKINLEQVFQTGNPSVLVIEDNSDMRSYIEQSLCDDFQVTCANDGQQGVELATSMVPDLIISDIMMPKKDGYQVTHELRSHPVTSHIPIILLTAKGDRDSRLKGWHQKADEYLTKPFDVVELKLRLHSLLEIRNIVKKRFAQTVFEVPASAQTCNNSPQENQQQNFVDQLNKTLEALYTQTDVSIADFADKMAVSERQLYRKLKSTLDITPLEYIRRFRLEKAKQLLQQGKSVSFVTFEVGFSTQSYFGKCFKAQFGQSPGDYKKSQIK
jgi:signal transduction histidine kinase/DNA-binding response OmpR family regulator